MREDPPPGAGLCVGGRGCYAPVTGVSLFFSPIGPQCVGSAYAAAMGERIIDIVGPGTGMGLLFGLGLMGWLMGCVGAFAAGWRLRSTVAQGAPRPLLAERRSARTVLPTYRRLL